MATRDQELAIRAARHGANYALTIIQEARRADILVSLALGLVEQESSDRITPGGRNIFGHDPGKPFSGAGKVTRAKVQAYLRQRGTRGQGGMQGVGLTQLTWWEYQDRAEKMGGLHWPRYQCRVAFLLLKDLEKKHGRRKALAIYNGGGSNPDFNYADQVLERVSEWHDRLT